MEFLRLSPERTRPRPPGSARLHGLCRTRGEGRTAAEVRLRPRGDHEHGVSEAAVRWQPDAGRGHRRHRVRDLEALVPRRLRCRRDVRLRGRLSGAFVVQSVSTLSPSTCARCGTRFHCGRDDASGCWCARLPPLAGARYDAASGCLCESCLRRLLDETAADRRQR
ncbi:MAG: cysteine-rich CWC family protein [Burkholderiaceae bacterium]